MSIDAFIFVFIRWFVRVCNQSISYHSIDISIDSSFLFYSLSIFILRMKCDFYVIIQFLSNFLFLYPKLFHWQMLILAHEQHG